MPSIAQELTRIETRVRELRALAHAASPPVSSDALDTIAEEAERACEALEQGDRAQAQRNLECMERAALLAREATRSAGMDTGPVLADIHADIRALRFKHEAGGR